MFTLPTTIEELTLHQAASLAGFRSASDLAKVAGVNQRTVAGMMRGEAGYPAARASVAEAIEVSEEQLTALIHNSRT